MKKLLSVLLLAVLLVTCASLAEETNTLSQGCDPTNALMVLVLGAMETGENVDYFNIDVDSQTSAISVKSDHFMLSVYSDARGMTSGFSVSCRYLDNDIALSMGKIFGYSLATLSDLKNLDTIVAAIDFDAFNTLKSNKQTLVYGDYKIVAEVDPAAKDYYKLSLQYINPSEANSFKTSDSEDILLRMGISTSAYFTYDETNDPNGRMGKSDEAYYAKTNFALTSIAPNATSSSSLEKELGGSIEVFKAPKYAINRMPQTMLNLVNFLNDYEYCFVCDSALLRLSPKVEPHEVGQIIEAFIIAVRNGK